MLNYKRRLVRIALWCGAGLLLLALATGVFVWWVGTGSIQDWIGTQIQSIANDYLGPHLSFSKLRYEYPFTVSIDDLHLTADDPTNPGHSTDIVACKHAVLSLAQIPRRGKPIQIEKIQLQQPLISFIATQERGSKFVGFSNLLRNSSDQPPPQQPANSPQKLSDVFRLRLVELKDGKVVYDPRIAGTVPMLLDHINTTVNVSPTSTDWYVLDTLISREPVFSLRVAGQLNVDVLSARQLDVQLLADLSDQKLQFLPPQLQALLRRLQAKGKVSAHVNGTTDLTDFAKGQVSAQLKVEHANLVDGSLHLPVDDLEVNAQLADGTLTLPSIKVTALGGTADVSGSVVLNDGRDSQLKLNIAGMEPQLLLADARLRSRWPARLDLELDLSAALNSLLGKVPAAPGRPLASIALKNFRLWADDPIHAGQKVDVMACQRLDVAMTQPILLNQPIRIDRIALDHPVISAIAVAPGSIRLVGVPAFPSSATAPDSASSSASPTADSPSAAPTLSRLVVVNSFQLNAAKMVYDPRIAGTQPMCLDPVNASLQRDPSEAGAYQVDVHVMRAPAFNCSVTGGVNLDHPGVKNLLLTLDADLDQNQLDFLPPQLQQILQQTHSHGKIKLTASGTAAVAAPQQSTAKLSLQVQNLNLVRNNAHMPLDTLSATANLEQGKLIENARISALNGVFELSGVSTLNQRLDTSVTLKLHDLALEPLLAQLQPQRPTLTTLTRANGEIAIALPLLAASAALEPTPRSPLATVSVRHLRLSTTNPVATTQPLDFVSCDNIAATISALPASGKPITVEHLAVDHPAIRAIALSPGSDQFAGFANVAAMMRQDRPLPTTQPTTAATTAPTTRQINLPLRLAALDINSASLEYNTQVANTVPFVVQHMSMHLAPDSIGPDASHFETLVAAPPDYLLKLSGRLNQSTLTIDPLTVDLETQLSPSTDPHHLPPQLQPMAPQGLLAVRINGRLPLLNWSAADAALDVQLDDGVFTAGNYRIPVDQVRLPMKLHQRTLSLPAPPPKADPTLSALGGSATIDGSVLLNDQLDSTLNIGINGMLLESLMADKITPPRSDLMGKTDAQLHFVKVPLLVAIAKAMQPNQDPSAPPSPLAGRELPPSWGSGEIHLTHARLAGLELIQGMSNITRSVFVDPFTGQKTQQQTVPEESAHVVMAFNHDHVDCSTIHYEGEDVGADGKGYLTLEQWVDLDITGGPMSKLAGLGSVGNWVSRASDSLLYYHVTGRIHDLHYEVKRGNGEPIVQGAKTVAQKTQQAAQKTGEAVGKGIDKAGSFFKGLFKH